jgi:hypothetical protein
MTDKQRLLALHVEAIRVRDGSLRALGMALNVPGNGLAVFFKVNPAVNAERDARSGMLHAFKALNLDVEPLRDGAGRPGR